MKKILLLTLLVAFTGVAEDKRIVLLAGARSHRPGDHEFRAGCILLNKWLNAVPGIECEMHTNGWPKHNGVFDGAAAVFIFCDGGGRHLRDRGAGHPVRGKGGRGPGPGR